MGKKQRAASIHVLHGNGFQEAQSTCTMYDIVSVADGLSHFESARQDKRFYEMLDIIESKANSDYQFVPESIYLKCKEWDFGQKKQPSPWLTYLCIRIMERSGRIILTTRLGHPLI